MNSDAHPAYCFGETIRKKKNPGWFGELYW
jgi:hypothetical protein